MPMKPAFIALLLALLSSGAAPAKGPLRVDPDNPRYFTDGTKGADGKFRAVYLTGAHTWDNLVDMGRDDPPAPFDFDAYLDALERDGHNFIRLWAWDSTVWDTRANGELGMDFVHHVAPQPWLRTGPGNAPDGKPKFDLTKFDDAYFERLRKRVDAAGRRGIYVSVMLFEGWGLFHGNSGRAAPEGWAWRSHPFNPGNNVNGLDVDGGVHRLGNRKVNDFQAAYVRKVVDAVNDFDNVLYEVINEGGQKEWDWWVVRTIKEHEKAKPKQHPVGLTGHGAERVDSMLASPADWVSPGRADGYAEDPPAWDATHGKVSLLDTDHVWGVGGSADWVWKAFLRGHNPIFMDPYKGQVLEQRGAKWDDVRRAMGETRRYAEKMNLAAMAPESKLASSGYCLASAARDELLVYLPKGGDVEVDLAAARGRLAVEWHSPNRNAFEQVNAVDAGGRRRLGAPFDGPAVLYLTAERPTRAAATGPLRVHPDNGRYFADGSGRAVYLTGSHTWPNLIDRGPSDPPPRFDFDWYLDLLQRHDHNFIRLWGRHVSWYHDYGAGDQRVLHAGPLAWPRTGPGAALDGKPRFDLSRFHEPYFERLRQRVAAARDRGIYVGVMLFGGYYECTGGWRGNPFNAANNINGIDGDPDGDGRGLETQTLAVPAVLRLQEAYVRRVVDTVNEFDNVLFEIGNECHTSSRDWQRHLIRYVRDHEKGRSKQHPVGMTALWGEDPKRDNQVLYESPADWVSPQMSEADIRSDLPAADGGKVSLLDSDHWFISAILGDAAFGRDWVWKAFCRGHNPILMEQVPMDSGSEVPVTTEDPGHVAARRAMGAARRLADRIDLAAMEPQPRLASSRYCLARPGSEYVAFVPGGGAVSVDLSAASGAFAVEWLEPEGAVPVAAAPVAGGARRELNAPFEGPAVVHLKQQAGADQSAGRWVPLFNGRDLAGWTPKITGRELGDNWRDTFRVEDGLLKVKYDQYPEFGGHFGHLFYKDKFSQYRLRVEYRFVGGQTKGGPGWAVRNSGAMLHCQDPKTMTKDQEFPVSIEVQFLGGDGRNERHTANLCTPGTHVEMGGRLITRHCTDSTSKTYHGDQWVTVEVEVRGNEVVRHVIDGKVVLEYNKPQLDDGDRDAKRLLEAGAPKMVSEGYISLQAESHPVEFRKVELMRLGP